VPNYLSVEKRKRIFHLICEGSCLRSITRIVGCSTNTVSQLQKRYSCIIEYLNKSLITELSMDEIEADEIRTFVQNISNVRWIYIALDRKSRMIIHFHIGNRDTADAKIFLSGLSQKLSTQSQVSTDCLKSYIEAVERNPYGRVDSAVYEIQLLRANRPGEYIGREITNRVEQNNGTVRQHVSRLIRRTRCFAKKEEGLRTQLVLFFFYYNFIKKHKAVKCPPAVAAGITDEANWLDKILEYDMLFSERMKAADHKSYGVFGGKAAVKSIGQTEKDNFLQQIAGAAQFSKRDKIAKVISI
jgi:IS1 family transposase